MFLCPRISDRGEWRRYVFWVVHLSHLIYHISHKHPIWHKFGLIRFWWLKVKVPVISRHTLALTQEQKGNGEGGVVTIFHIQSDLILDATLKLWGHENMCVKHPHFISCSFLAATSISKASSTVMATTFTLLLVKQVDTYKESTLNTFFITFFQRLYYRYYLESRQALMFTVTWLVGESIQLWGGISTLCMY